MLSQAASATSSLSCGDALLRSTEELLRASTEHAVFGAVLKGGLTGLEAVGGCVFTLPANGGPLELAASQGDGLHATGPRVQEDGGHALPCRPRQFGAAQEALKRGVPLYAEGAVAPDLAGTCVALPLQLDPEVLGVLTFDIARPLPLTDGETHFLQILAAQGALALGRVRMGARLEARVQARTAELEAQIQLLEEQRARLDAFVTYKEAVGSERDVLVLAAQAVQAVRASLPHVSVAYYELEDQLWKARVWSEDVSGDVLAQMRAGVPLEAPSFAEALRTQSAVFVDGWNAGSNRLPSAWQYGAAALVPLLIGGEPRGLFAVGTSGAHAWTERERAIVRAVARGLGLTLERTEQARQLALERSTLAARTQALEAFAELTRDLSLSADPYTLIERAEVTVLSLLPPGYAAFWEVRDGVWRATRLTGDVGSAELQAVIDAGLPAGQTPTLDIPQQTCAPFYQDVYPHGADAPAGAVRHVHAVATLPVVVSGQVRGVFNVPLFGVRRWSAADRAVLETVVRSLGLALERAAAQQALDRSQHHLRVVAENAPPSCCSPPTRRGSSRWLRAGCSETWDCGQIRRWGIWPRVCWPMIRTCATKANIFAAPWPARSRTP